MRARSIVIFVIVVTFATPAETILDARSPRPVYQDDDPVMDAAAYLVYDALLPRVRTYVSKEPILLQRETERSAGCEPLATGWDAEWTVIARAFTGKRMRECGLCDRWSNSRPLSADPEIGDHRGRCSTRPQVPRGTAR